MFKIHNWRKGSRFCKVVWIFFDFADIADKDPGQKLFTDIGSNDFFALLYPVIIIL